MAAVHDETLSERTPLLTSTPSREPIRRNDEKPDSLSAWSPRLWLLIGAYTVILFLCAANGTALAPALGAIAESLRAYEQAATWFNASYMIASSCTTPCIGRLATIFSPTHLFLLCTLAFSLGGVIAGSANGSAIFIAGRVLTGCGTGGLFTTATVLLVEAAPVHRRGLFVGLINTVITSGSSLGGVISGAFVASRFGWRPTFFFQTPLVLLSAICIFLTSPPSPSKHPNLSLRQKFAKIDYLGIITLSASLFLLLQAAMAKTFEAIPLIAGILVMGIFLVVEAKVAVLPIIPVNVLFHLPTLFGCLSALCTMAARWTNLFYSPVWSMAVLGFHPAAAGATLIPTSAGFALSGLIVGAAFVKHEGGYYWQSLVSIIGLLATYLIFNALVHPAHLSLYLALLVGNGLAIGAILNFTLGHILSTTSEKAIVTGLYSTFRGLAPSAGAGLAGGIVQRVLESSLTRYISRHHGGSALSPDDLELIRRLKGSPALVWQLDGWKKQAGMLAYEEAIKSVFWLGAGASVAAFLVQAATRFGRKTDNTLDARKDSDSIED